MSKTKKVYKIFLDENGRYRVECNDRETGNRAEFIVHSMADALKVIGVLYPPDEPIEKTK